MESDMDKLEQIRELMHQNTDYATKFCAVLKVLEDADSPPRNLLAVDESTPVGTMCIFDKDYRPYIVPLTAYSEGKAYSQGSYISPNAERFIGIHLLPNPGYQPCEGLVLYTFEDRVYLEVAEALNWKIEAIIDFCPVKWENGHLVADPERLR